MGMTSQELKTHDVVIPKKPQTGFFEFMAEFRSSEPGDNKQKMVSLSEKWNNMTTDEKEKYNKIFREEMETWKKEISALKETEEGRAALEELEKAKKEKRRNKAVKSGKKAKKSKKPRDATPYNLFVKDSFPAAKGEWLKTMPEGTKVQVSAVMKIIAERWTSLSEEKKKQWTITAEELKSSKKEKENVNES